MKFLQQDKHNNIDYIGIFEDGEDETDYSVVLEGTTSGLKVQTAYGKDRYTLVVNLDKDSVKKCGDIITELNRNISEEHKNYTNKLNFLYTTKQKDKLVYINEIENVTTYLLDGKEVSKSDILMEKHKTYNITVQVALNELCVNHGKKTVRVNPYTITAKLKTNKVEERKKRREYNFKKSF